MEYLLQFVTLVVFTFAAPAFTVLTFSYWRQERRRNLVFRLFTVICSVVFLANLASIAFFIDYPAISTARALLVSLLPPMMFHLVLTQDQREKRRLIWRILLWGLYSTAVISTLASLTSWRQFFSPSPAIILGAVSLSTLGLLFAGFRNETSADRRQRFWNIAIFSLLFATATAAFFSENPFFDLVPDYLVLLFFAVRLYYTERLAFFDSFVKGGSYFAAGAVLLGVVLLGVPPFRSIFLGDWIHAWVGILALVPIWLLGPFVSRSLQRGTDHLLHRKFSAIEAEQFFLQSIQTSNDETQLRENAAHSLEEIFRCSVEVDFDYPPGRKTREELVCGIGSAGGIRLFARKNQIPFLSDDRRLLETLSASLGFLLQNTRLRQQQQQQLRREQELASLASRAELRALRAQINPHFLFNALNAIAGWIRTEPEFADETLAELAEVFRYTLHRSQHEWVQVQDEVEFIRAYLAVERARFRDRLETTLAVEPAANAILIPAMVIQPLIENAIKHGISPVSTAGTVSLAIHLRDDVLRIEVTDTGPGFPSDFRLNESLEGHGLRNVADRLKGYYGEGGTIAWCNTPSGSKVTLEVPARRHL